jgi:hypothetical protein
VSFVDFLAEEAIERFYDAITIVVDEGPESVGAVAGHFPGLPLGPTPLGAAFAGHMRDLMRQSRECKGMRKKK